MELFCALTSSVTSHHLCKYTQHRLKAFQGLSWCFMYLCNLWNYRNHESISKVSETGEIIL